jgi:hypothetical protein
MNGMEKAYLYWNTVRRLKPVQIRYQIENRIRRDRKKKYIDAVDALPVPKKRNAVRLLMPELDCGSGYLKRFPVDRLMLGEVTLLHESHALGKEWKVPAASHLWNYNLHYLEFLIPLAVRYVNTGEEACFAKWKELAEGWLGQSSGDSLEPYPISMRIPNLLICMELLEEKLNGTKLEEKLWASVYRQYRYLLLTQEKALLANHYFENLKAIVISALLFEETDIYHKYFDLFLKEIEEEILPDGLHFERSLMYHKIILEDILRVYKALRSVHRIGDAQKLIPAIRMMASAMMYLEQGFERTPLFNDAGNNVSKDKDALLRAVAGFCSDNLPVPMFGILSDSREIAAWKISNALPDENGKQREAITEGFEASGYFKMYYGEIALLFDCGEIGPSYMGGHAHNDCLSFELCVKGRFLFVNSGTGQYQGGLRPFFRSTAAHNTVMIDSCEQSELWGEHRAARRLRKVRGGAEDGMLTGRFQSFRGDFFRRSLKWKSGNENVLVIRDDVSACDTERHIVRQFLHLAPGCRYRRSGEQIEVLEEEALRAVIKLPAKCDYLIHGEGVLTNYAEDFGEYRKKEVLEIRTPFQGKVRLRIEIELP